MRNRICLALALLGALARTPAYSQPRPGSVLERKVTVSFRQVPLETVLQTLRTRYGVRISYSNTALNLRQPVTLSVQNQPLRTVLNTVLADKNIGYDLVGDQVVLHSRRPAPTGSKATTAPALPPAKATKPPVKPPITKSAPAEAAGTGVSGKSGTQSVKEARPAAHVAAQDSVPKSAPASADSLTQPVNEGFRTPKVLPRRRNVQVSLLGPLGSNGLRSDQIVNKVSVNLLGGYSAGVDGIEAAGLFNVTRDSVRGGQVAGLANVVGRHLDGVQAAGLFNALGGGGRGWQAAGLFNAAARPVSGAQTAGLFNYNGPFKANPVADASLANGEAVPAAAPEARPKMVQAAGLFNLSLNEVNGVQVAGLFNAAGTVHGVQLAGLVNFADSVDGVSIAPFNFVRHGYHRLEVANTETWPVGASLKLGGSPTFYTFFTGAYQGFGSSKRWGLGYGVGTELLARRRISIGLDAAAMHVNEESRGWTRDLNLHNQLRLLVGVAPFKAGGRLRVVAGPTVSVLVTQRYDAERGAVASSLSQNRRLWLNEGNASTQVLGWVGYCVGLRF